MKKNTYSPIVFKDEFGKPVIRFSGRDKLRIYPGNCTIHTKMTIDKKSGERVIWGIGPQTTKALRSLSPKDRKTLFDAIQIRQGLTTKTNQIIH